MHAVGARPAMRSMHSWGEVASRGQCYAVQRSETPVPYRAATPVRVPREACETPTLRQRLQGFALKPLIRANSHKRSERIRREIEQQQSISEAKGLWSDSDFAFVAEAKAKTIQLRHRTLTLLKKIDSFEHMPTLPTDPAAPPNSPSSPQSTRVEASREMSAEQSVHDPPAMIPKDEFDENSVQLDALVHDSGWDGLSGEPKCHRQTMKSIKANMRERVTGVVLAEQADDLLAFLSSKSKKDAKAEFNSLDTGDKLRWSEATLHEKAVDALNRSRSKDSVDDSTSRRCSAPASSSPTPMTRKSTHTGEDMLQPLMEDSAVTPVLEGDTSIVRPFDRASTTGAMQEDANRRESVRFSVSGKRRNTNLSMMRQSWVKSNKRKSRKSNWSQLPVQRRPTGTVEENAEVLHEDQREIPGVSDSCGIEFGHIRILAESDSDGIKIEVSLTGSEGQEPQAVKSRKMSHEEVQRLLEFGHMHEQPAQDRYHWICGLVCLDFHSGEVCVCAENCEPSMQPCQTCGANVEFGKKLTIALKGFDAVTTMNPTKEIRNMQRESVVDLRDGVRNSFNNTLAIYREQSKADHEVVEVNKTFEHERKIMEIQAVSKRFKLAMNSTEAIHALFVKFDSSGDGKINEEEFSDILRGIMVASGQHEPDADIVKRHWRSFRSYSDKIVFMQFAEFVVSKFPRVQKMTAFEVSRFADRVNECMNK